MPNETDRPYTVNALSDVLGFDRRSLKRWLRDVEPAGEVDGNPVYRLEAAQAAITRHLKQRGNKSGAKDRLIELQAQKLEVQIKILRGEYTPTVDAEKWGAELGAAIRKVVSTIHHCAPNVVGGSVAEAETILKATESEILQQLHLLKSANSFPCPHCNRDIFEEPNHANSAHANSV